jgi:hypothetical protein
MGVTQIGLNNVQLAGRTGSLMLIPNEIDISFPQRDLHIKDAVPLKILKESPQPVAKDSPEIDSDKKRAAD